MKNTHKPGAGILICILLIILYFLCYVGIVTINALGQYTIPVMGSELSLDSCNGILISVQMLICTVMTVILAKKGSIIALILPAFSILSMTSKMIRLKDPAVIPGISMLFVCFLSVLFLRRQILSRERDALTDYLTGLHNRRSIIRNLEMLTKKGKPFSIIYVDIDDFKFVNDNYGHKAGDSLIREFAKRITAEINSKSIPGRIGGDEFIVLVPGQNEVMKTAEKLYESAKKEVLFDDSGANHYITASIGIARFPDDASTASEMIKCSDIAMYNAKASGKNTICCFNKKYEEELLRKTSIEALIKQYLTNQSFMFAYQPQYSSGEKKLRGFETLLRIRDEDRKMASTSELISVAEKSDLIFQIDEYVLRHALTEFRETALRYSDITMSVNVSAKHISQKGFVMLIERILEETGFPAKNLEIEITEYCLAGSVKTTIENMKKLREMGIQLALDDFGTGYASLSYLSKFPVSLLKIDKSFIDSLESDSENSTDFISAVISMGHILGCEVISEGVETQHQLDILREKKCDFIQGFLWGTPLSLNKATELCSSGFENK